LSHHLHSFARRIDLDSGLIAARVAAAPAADFAALLNIVTAARRAGGWPGLVVVPAPDLAFRDPGALDALAKANGLDPRGLTFEAQDAGAEGLNFSALAKLRARGWGLSLVVTPGEAPALGARDRSLLSMVTVRGDWAAAAACPALARRVRAAQACGALAVWAGSDGPQDPRMVRAFGYDAVDVAEPAAKTGCATAQLARAYSAEQASSFSIR